MFELKIYPRYIFIQKLLIKITELFIKKKNKPVRRLSIYNDKEMRIKKCRIQLSSKKIIEKNLNKIVKEDTLLESINKRMVSAIFKNIKQEKKQPLYRITSQYFEEEVDNYHFEIVEIGSSRFMRKNLQELFENIELISKFDVLDIRRIGYLEGVRETMLESNSKKQSILE